MTNEIINVATETAKQAIQWPEAFMWVGVACAVAFAIVGFFWAVSR